MKGDSTPPPCSALWGGDFAIVAGRVGTRTEDRRYSGYLAERPAILPGREGCSLPVRALIALRNWWGRFRTRSMASGFLLGTPSLPSTCRISHWITTAAVRPRPRCLTWPAIRVLPAKPWPCLWPLPMHISGWLPGTPPVTSPRFYAGLKGLVAEGVVLKHRRSPYVKQLRPGVECRDWLKR